MKNFRRNFSAIVNDMPAGIEFTIQQKQRKQHGACFFQDLSAHWNDFPQKKDHPSVCAFFQEA